MFYQNESVEITHKLLIALGLEIQSGTNVIIDQETKSQLTFENKFIKANINPESAMYVSEYDIKFEPLNPKCTKLMERMFGRFLDMESSEDIQAIPEVTTYYFDRNTEEEFDKYRLTIKFVDGNVWIGNWYMNKVICYDEAIFCIDGTFEDEDLRIYDVEPD